MKVTKPLGPTIPKLDGKTEGSQFAYRISGPSISSVPVEHHGPEKFMRIYEEVAKTVVPRYRYVNKRDK